MHSANRIRFASSPGSVVQCYVPSRALASPGETIVTTPAMDKTQVAALCAQGRINDRTAAAVSRLHEIHGLTHLIVREHEIFVMLEKAAWADVHPVVVTILTEEVFEGADTKLENYSGPRCGCQHCD